MTISFISDTEFHTEHAEIQGRIYPEHEKNFVQTKFINPNCAIAYVAMKMDNIVVCLAVIYDNPHFDNDTEKIASIGYFEALNEPEIVDQFFHKIKQYLNALHYTALIGPINGSTWFSYRFQINKGKRPFFSEPWHPAYYVDFFKSNGFDMLSEYESNYSKREDLSKFNTATLEKGLKCRVLKMAEIEAELVKFYALSMDAFSDAFLFSPIKSEDFLDLYRPIIPYIDPNLVWFIEDENHRVEAFILGLIDHFDPKKETIIIKTIAKGSHARIKNLINFGMKLLYQKMKERNYKYLVHALIHFKNHASARASRGKLKGHPLRIYQLFKCDLGD